MISWAFLIMLPSGKCDTTLFMIYANIDRYRTLIDTVRQQAITWTNTNLDLFHHGPISKREYLYLGANFTYCVLAWWCYQMETFSALLELIGTYTNHCEHVQSNMTIRSLRIVLQRTESLQTGVESQCECTTNRCECRAMRYEPIGTDTNWYDVRRCNTTQYE